MQVGGGGVEYLTENFFSLRNVPGVLKTQKKIKNIFFCWGGGGAKNFRECLINGQ